MSRVLLITFAVIIPAISSIAPFSCRKGVDDAQETVRDFGPLLDSPPIVRILVVDKGQKAYLAIKGPYQIAGSLNNILYQGSALPKTAVTVTHGAIKIGNERFKNGELRITSLNDGDIELNGVTYRGKFRVQQQQNNTFSVIEEVDLENVVIGALGQEMPQAWNQDALRAQAIAIRTYVMHKRKSKQNESYHLDSLDLAYRGMRGETPRTSKVVQETSGIVMLHKWKLFPAYFHSTCGGQTEDAGSVFEKDDIPALSGVECNYCSDSKFYSWSKKLNKSLIERKLRDAKIKVSGINTVKAIPMNGSKHGAKVEIITSNGSKKMNANRFRLLIGPNKLYSTAFHSRNNGSSITFTGNGWGHGVGLCQYGAQAMAKKGFYWARILKHYYSEIELVRIY